MSDAYGSDFISISDEDGNEFELEYLDTFEVNQIKYMAFLPADGNEDDEDYGIIILKVLEENGEEILSTPDDDEELNLAYDAYMERLFDGDGAKEVPEEIPEEDS